MPKIVRTWFHKKSKLISELRRPEIRSSSEPTTASSTAKIGTVKPKRLNAVGRATSKSAVRLSNWM